EKGRGTPRRGCHARGDFAGGTLPWECRAPARRGRLPIPDVAADPGTGVAAAAHITTFAARVELGLDTPRGLKPSPPLLPFSCSNLRRSAQAFLRRCRMLSSGSLIVTTL